MFVMPKVGDKVTVNYYSVFQPAQVVKVAKSGKTMWIRENVTTPATDERECNKWNIHGFRHQYSVILKTIEEEKHEKEYEFEDGIPY